MNEDLKVIAGKRGVPSIRRHLFLCCDQTKPNCCTKEQGLASWDYLKKRLDELELTGFFAILENEDDILIRLTV